MNAYKPGTDWTMDMLRTAETVATLETPKERAKATLEALIAAEGRGARLSAAPEMLEAALLCLDANGHLRGCEAGAGTDGNEDNCTAYCTALRKAVAKAEGRAS